jgi:hypothetical protein
MKFDVPQIWNHGIGPSSKPCDVASEYNALTNLDYSQDASKNRIPVNINRMIPERAQFSLSFEFPPLPSICIHQMEHSKKDNPIV